MDENALRQLFLMDQAGLVEPHDAARPRRRHDGPGLAHAPRPRGPTAPLLNSSPLRTQHRRPTLDCLLVFFFFVFVCCRGAAFSLFPILLPPNAPSDQPTASSLPPRPLPSYLRPPQPSAQQQQQQQQHVQTRTPREIRSPPPHTASKRPRRRQTRGERARAAHRLSPAPPPLSMPQTPQPPNVDYYYAFGEATATTTTTATTHPHTRECSPATRAPPGAPPSPFGRLFVPSPSPSPSRPPPTRTGGGAS